MSLLSIYRISDNSYVKPKMDFATKIYCFENFLKAFDGKNVCVLLDSTNLKSETASYFKEKHSHGGFKHLISTEMGSSAASFRTSAMFAIGGGHENFPINEDDNVLHQEDDYLYVPHAESVIEEGLEKSDYVTGYLHGDRFAPGSISGNKFIGDDGSFLTRVFKTKSSFWCEVESTTMTFAVKTKTLAQDYPTWLKYISDKHPDDHRAFIELTEGGRRLITTIPGICTHTEPAWASPLVDWRNV